MSKNCDRLSFPLFLLCWHSNDLGTFFCSLQQSSNKYLRFLFNPFLWIEIYAIEQTTENDEKKMKNEKNALNTITKYSNTENRMSHSN